MMEKEYQQLPKANDIDKDNLNRHKTTLPSKLLCFNVTYYTVGGMAVLFWLLLIGGSILVKSATTPDYMTSRASDRCACGSSASEAIANGCRFDPYGLIWLPDKCQDKELMSMFAELGSEQNHNWTFFEFPDRQRRLPLDEVAAMAGDPSSNPGRVLTTLDWHNSHCLYTLLRVARSADTDLSVAKRYASETHTRHCATKLMGLVATHQHAENPFGDSGVYVYPSR